MQFIRWIYIAFTRYYLLIVISILHKMLCHAKHVLIHTVTRLHLLLATRNVWCEFRVVAETFALKPMLLAFLNSCPHRCKLRNVIIANECEYFLYDFYFFSWIFRWRASMWGIAWNANRGKIHMAMQTQHTKYSRYIYSTFASCIRVIQSNGWMWWGVGWVFTGK